MSDFLYVKEFGAKGDGVHKDTVAIQKAIDTCHENGGGYVVLAGGNFISGTLYLKSNVYLKIQVSATLTASPDIKDYGVDTHYNRYVNETEMDPCFIYGEDAVNIGIIGEGLINGNAEYFPNEGDKYRPMLIRFLRCQNIHINNIRLHNTAAWTTAFLDSEYIWVDGVDIQNDKKYNGDGLDFDGCKNVFVSNSRILGTDDNLCLQASSKEYPVKNIHITNCMFTSICAGIRIGLKSIGDISNVVISNCTFENVWREGIKIECTEGGTITDISVSNLTMKNVTRPIFIILNNRLENIGSSVGLTVMPEIGTMERIHISDVNIHDTDEMKNTHYRFRNDVMGAPYFNGIRVDAAKNKPIAYLSLRNIHYTFIGGVKKSEIREEYPYLVDKRIYPDVTSSENYYPDWSRTAFMDIRNVEYLILDSVIFHAIYKDEREDYIIENCKVITEDIKVI